MSNGADYSRIMQTHGIFRDEEEVGDIYDLGFDAVDFGVTDALVVASTVRNRDGRLIEVDAVWLCGPERSIEAGDEALTEKVWEVLSRR